MTTRMPVRPWDASDRNRGDVYKRQLLSSVEHDYRKDGFVSQSKEEELPVPGLTVRYLRETVDVSDRINSQIAWIKEEHLRLAAAD